MTETKALMLMPWGKTPGTGSWDRGQFVSVDGAQTGPVEHDDVSEVLYFGTTGKGWDGKEAAVMRLWNAIYVAYETWWDATGDGFTFDAYGGDADLYFATDLNTLVLTALSDEGRRLCGIPVEGL